VQNSPGIALAAFVVAIILAGATIVSLMAGVGGDPALNELQIGAAAWALTFAMFGVQGIVSIVLEGRQVSGWCVVPRQRIRRADARAVARSHQSARVAAFEYLEPPEQAPLRLALGVGALTFVGMLLFASYYDQIGLTLGQIWLLVLSVPLVVGAAMFGWSRLICARRAGVPRFDPTSEE